MTVTTNSTEIRSGGLYISLLGIWLIATMSLWGLAFFHLPEATPEWVLRAQSACFGTNENGLPDGYGWMVLIFSPLSFLIAMFVVFKDQIAEEFSQLLDASSGRFLLTLVSLTVIAQAVWVTSRIVEGIAISNTDYAYSTSEEFPENYPRLNREAMSFNLVDHNGKDINLDSLKGRVVFITFAFAHCKTICPSIVKSVSNTQDKLSHLPLSSLIITLDPWRDTPNNLASQAKRWKLGENAHFLSGDVDSVRKVLDDYSVARERDMKTGDVTHPALVYVLDTKGKIAYTFNNPYPSWLEGSVERLLKERVVVDKSPEPQHSRISKVIFSLLFPINRFFDRLYHSKYNPMYRSGAIAAAMLCVLMVTGVYLLFFYQISSPYESLENIQNNAFLGKWVRAIHRYATDITLIAVVVHILQLISQGRTWGPKVFSLAKWSATTS